MVNPNPPTPPRSGIRRMMLRAVVVLTAPLWLAWAAVYLLARSLLIVVLYALVWSYWIGRARRRVLFVYSDSPSWKAYTTDRACTVS